ncbi:MAG: hypothetical protein KKF50_03330 [Nanoarchaeota archaeon]|nr:hypothetical protein [Nanoarchaeota archaeon]
MGWFSKKEEVPEIAPAPSLPDLPKMESEAPKNDLPELPSFPSNASNENLNQEIVKSAVTDNLSSGEDGVNMEIPTDFHTTSGPLGEYTIPPRPSVEIFPKPESSTPIVSQQVIPSIPRPAAPTSQPIIPPAPKRMALELNAIKEGKPITKPIEPIYIRIDKFQSAQKNFEQVKEKVREIESLLQKVKDVKSQEENELNGWTEDIEKIKARLSEVDSEIFDQL